VIVLSYLRLVRTCAVDAVECLAEVAGEGVGSGNDVAAGLDLDGVVAAGRSGRTS
jgi:hypothetical protein